MYLTSELYKKQVLETSRLWDLRVQIKLQDGTILEIDKETIKLSSFVYKEGSVCLDAIHTGATYSNSVEFTILNKDNRFSKYEFYGAKVFPRVGLYIESKDSYEYVPLGEFNVIEPVKKMTTIPLVCFDNMVLLNKPFDFSQIVFPTTVFHIYQEVLVQCGVAATNSLDLEVQNLNNSVGSFLTDESTCRDILAGLGVLLLKNLRFNRSGLLESYWYTQTDVETTSDTRVGNSTFGDTAYTITGVTVEDAYGNVFSVGSGEYPIELPTSPLLQDSEVLLPILSQTLTLLQEYEYRPTKITWLGNPAVQAGDVLTHKETPVGTAAMHVMRVLYKFAGTSTLDSVAPDNSTLSQNTSNERRARKTFAQTTKWYRELSSRIEQNTDEVRIVVSDVTGIRANAVYETVDEFYLSVSPVYLSGGSWSTKQPEWTEGWYLWRRSKVTKGDGTVTYTPSVNGVCITGNTGADGAPGSNGADAIVCRIDSSTGYTFKIGETATLTARIFVGQEEIDPNGESSYTWYRRIDGGDYQAFANGKTVTVSADVFTDNMDVYFVCGIEEQVENSAVAGKAIVGIAIVGKGDD